MLFCFIVLLHIVSHLAGKTCQTAAVPLETAALALCNTNTLAHAGKYTLSHTHECKMSRDKPLVHWLYVSADPALIQQTKLSPLNAQQKSSLAVIMHPPRPAAPQCTILSSPLTSLPSLTSIISIQYLTLICLLVIK